MKTLFKPTKCNIMCARLLEQKMEKSTTKQPLRKRCVHIIGLQNRHYQKCPSCSTQYPNVLKCETSGCETMAADNRRQRWSSICKWVSPILLTANSLPAAVFTLFGGCSCCCWRRWRTALCNITHTKEISQNMNKIKMQSFLN